MMLNIEDAELELEPGKFRSRIRLRLEESKRIASDHAPHIAQARAQYTNDECEIDDNPAISESDDGAWVAAWVWVSREEVEL